MKDSLPINYGICHLSLVPVRSEPSDKAELTTQLLFGEVFSVLKISENKKWLKIEISHDDYQGWVDAKQYRSVNQKYYQAHTETLHPYTHHGIAIVAVGNTSFPILGGSTLPFLNENFEIDLGYAKGEVINNFEQHIGNSYFDDWALEYALTYLAAPYLWGGRTFFGVDCSGFVQQIFKHLFKPLPRDAWQQAEMGNKIDLTEAKQGDLAFFNSSPNETKITHVGIVLEGDKIIHASGEVRIDKLDTTGIFNEELQSYSHYLLKVIRV